jgi:hypothetical protein
MIRTLGKIIQLNVLCIFIYSCNNEDYSRIERISKDNPHIYNKICYVFFDYKYIIPCRKFNVSNFYEGLNNENLEPGFVYSEPSLPHYQYLSLLFSADTFLLYTKKGLVDTLKIVPAYVEYIHAPNPQKSDRSKVSDFILVFENRKIQIVTYSEPYIILNIIPLRPYNLEDKCLLLDSLSNIYYSKAPISKNLLKGKWH